MRPKNGHTKDPTYLFPYHSQCFYVGEIYSEASNVKNISQMTL